MFFSHTFLARKGPLGTVWCAAHLQHRLKKSHYTSTDIPSTVERIMWPEVPIALRMSGHLLLGVVRIYSKQVDYLYDYCNDVRITINRVFTFVNVNLPEDANHAPYHSVTLPQTFDLDALDVDDFFKDWGQDSHMKSLDDITMMGIDIQWLLTLADQVPTGKDPYVVISFNEDDFRGSSPTQENLASETQPLEDVPPPVQPDSHFGHVDQSPQSRIGFDERTIGNSSPKDLPSIEIMRNAKHGFDFNNSPILPDRADPDKYLEEQILKEKGKHTPVRADEVFPDGHSPSSHRHEEQHSFEHLDTSINFGGFHRTPEMEIQVTPPVAQPKVQRKKRKRKQFFDESTVFSNQHMKNALSDTAGVRRVKQNCPCSLLDIWKVNKRLKKDGVFFEPLISGSCAALQDIHREDFITSKPHLIISEKEHQETNVSQSMHVNGDNIEIEYLRCNEDSSPGRFIPLFSNMTPPSIGRSRRSQHTPKNSNHDFQSERLETSEGYGTLPITTVGLSSGLPDSEMRTPETFLGDGILHEHTALFDIPELLDSAGELGFLEQEDNSPAGSKGTPEFGLPSINQGTPEFGEMSARTRAVAQYLKRQSSTNPFSSKSGESSSVDLSMNTILEGKPRKICARMFSETLVLKNYGLVDLHQEGAYNDITLKISPQLSKGQFSG
ncbi:sister chromatid cohesion 1 protein 3-like [Dorcoceras hygrometricum]|uniref:Sister chromatid cohesion 1 protein 3-like n=1 Tax=Dorcoceras hygrometricum TaxID=472368 RepID=A0A2Z7ALK4_9LAMI|nr:sister chromatid cohesion 1 protein 3-like [Dorcoceras hygrometricum]